MTINKNNKLRTTNRNRLLNKPNNRMNRSSQSQDIKFCDVAANGLVITSTATLIGLQPIQNGTGPNERIGSAIEGDSLRLTYTFYAGTALIGSPNSTVRVILFYDNRQIDSTSPSATDVIFPTVPSANYNYYNLSRWTVLHDSKYAITGYDKSVITKKFNFKLKKIMRYSGLGLSSITQNGLYLMICSDNIVNPPTFDYFSRLYYKDS